MRTVVLLFVMGVVMVSAGEPSIKNSERFLKNQLGLRAGIYFDRVAFDAPEDKLYPIAENIGKVQQSYSMHGVHLLAEDLPRLARMFREVGCSDGVFNTMDGICPLDEWDRRYYYVATRDDNGQLVPLSKAEITKKRINSRPYLWNTTRYFSTLGQLTKHCDGVFIGEVVKVKFKRPPDSEETSDFEDGCDDEYNQEDIADFFHEVTLSFRVRTNIFGNVTSRRVTIPMLWVERPLPVKGMKLLCFYIRGHKYNVFDDNTWDFLWEKPPLVQRAPLQMMHEYGGCVKIIDEPEVERVQVDLANAYLQILRREKRDPVKYYELLRSLVRSPVWRTRQDAREDLLNLLRRPPDGWDLRPLADDPELAGIFRDYVRYVVIPKQEQGQTDAANGAVSRKPDF